MGPQRDGDFPLLRCAEAEVVGVPCSRVCLEMAVQILFLCCIEVGVQRSFMMCHSKGEIHINNKLKNR